MIDKINFIFQITAAVLFIVCMTCYMLMDKVDFLVFAVIFLIHGDIFSRIKTRGE